MVARVEAIRNAGFGCVKGMHETYRDVEKIVDTGTAYEIFLKGKSIVARKEDWEIVLTEE